MPVATGGDMSRHGKDAQADGDMWVGQEVGTEGEHSLPRAHEILGLALIYSHHHQVVVVRTVCQVSQTQFA